MCRSVSTNYNIKSESSAGNYVKYRFALAGYNVKNRSVWADNSAKYRFASAGNNVKNRSASAGYVAKYRSDSAGNATVYRSSEQKNKTNLLLVVVLILCIVTIVVFSLYKTAQAGEDIGLNKYYRSVSVHTNDTLWAIAEENISGSGQSIPEYISEVRDINHLSSDKIKSGMKLVVPYYDE